MATITLNLTHITCAEGISITQNEGTPVLLHLTPDSNYILPNSITFGSAIVGGVYDMPNKTISFTMPATNSTITAVAVQLNTLDKVIVDKQTFIDRETAIANALSGLRPTQYLKSIVKTEVDRKIEITYNDAGGDHNVSFEYGFTQPTWDIIGGDPATSTGLTTYLETNYIHSSERATANGVATLDASGHIPTEQLAGSVAEVKEGYYHDGEFYEESTYVTPLPHLENAIYFDKGDSYRQYRWVGSSFVAIASNITVNSARDVGTATSAYRADFGVANYNDILTLQTGKQPLLSATNKLNTEFIATDANARFVTDLEKTAWSNKQNALTFDITPTESSTNPVTSGGIKTYVDNKIVGALVFKGSVPTYADLPTLASTPDLDTGWEYNVTGTNTLYAAVVDRSFIPATLTWNLMGNSISLSGYQRTSDKNIANGYAGLDANGKVSHTLLDVVTGAKGDAETNYRTGDVNITKANIGLGNVDNTADIDKPVSTAVAQAIALVEAKQLYKTNTQGSFATKAELLSATTFYDASGATATPTKNDVAYVLADEDHNNKTAKYVIASISGTTITWGFVIAFVDTQFTQEQMDAINSGITGAKVTAYDNYATTFLPLAGGTMTGSITVKDGDASIKSNDNTSYVRICGGTTYENGSSLILRGSQNSTAPGSFKLIVKSGSITKELFGQNTGDLMWDNKYVLTTAGTTNSHPIEGNLLFNAVDKPATEASVLRQFKNSHTNSGFNFWAGTNWDNGAFFELYGNEGKTSEYVEGVEQIVDRSNQVIFGCPYTTAESTTDTHRLIIAPNGTSADCTIKIDNKEIVRTLNKFGSSSKPIYLTSAGIVQECSSYAGGTSLTINGVNKGGSSASVYAPTTYGNAGQVIVSGGNNATPEYSKFSNISSTLTNQSRDLLFSYTTDAGDNANFSFIGFDSSNSPDGSTSSRWVCEVHRNDSLYGYIIAKNRNGCYITNFNSGTWGDWVKFATGSFLPLSGGTMSGTIKLASTGLQTYNSGGYKTDQYGNFIHLSTTNTQVWSICNNAGTQKFKVNYETGALTATGALAMGSNKITGLATPTANTDAATKAYVDGLIGFSTGTPGTGTSISNSSSFYIKFNKLVVVSIKAKATASRSSGATLLNGLPAAAVETGGTLVSDAGGKRIVIAAGATAITLDSSSIASGDWFNGTIVYYTN